VWGPGSSPSSILPYRNCHCPPPPPQQVQTWKGPTEDAVIFSDTHRDVETDPPYESQQRQFSNFLFSGSYGQLQGLEGSAQLSGRRRSVLLIESLPSAAAVGEVGDSPLDRLRGTLQGFIENSRAAPGILIFSDVSERSEGASALHRLLSRDICDSPLVTIIEFNPITDRELITP